LLIVATAANDFAVWRDSYSAYWLVVSGDGSKAPTGLQVPTLNERIFTTGNETLAVRKERYRADMAEMPFDRGYHLASFDRPELYEVVVTSACQKAIIVTPRESPNSAGMSTQGEKLLARVDTEYHYSLIVAARRKKSTI
jgi:hypothetical protein